MILDERFKWTLAAPATAGSHISLGTNAHPANPGPNGWMSLDGEGMPGSEMVYMQFKLTTAFTAANTGSTGLQPQIQLGVAYSDSSATLPAGGNVHIPLVTGAALQLTNTAGTSAEIEGVRGMTITGGHSNQDQLRAGRVGQCAYVPIMYPFPLLWDRRKDATSADSYGIRRLYIKPVAWNPSGRAEFGTAGAGTASWSAGAFECTLVKDIRTYEGVLSDGSLVPGQYHTSGMKVT